MNKCHILNIIFYYDNTALFLNQFTKLSHEMRKKYIIHLITFVEFNFECI